MLDYNENNVWNEKKTFLWRNKGKWSRIRFQTKISGEYLICNKRSVELDKERKIVFNIQYFSLL